MGQKPKEEKRVAVRISEDLKRRLKAAASAKGVDLQDFADQAIETYLAECEQGQPKRPARIVKR